MAWSMGDKRPSNEGLVGHRPRTICRGTDCFCPLPEPNAYLRILAVRDARRDEPRGQSCPHPEHSRFFMETAVRWVTRELRPACPICLDTDCVCPPFEDDGFFRGMARFV